MGRNGFSLVPRRFLTLQAAMLPEPSFVQNFARKAPHDVDVFFRGMSDEISGVETFNRRRWAQDECQSGR